MFTDSHCHLASYKFAPTEHVKLIQEALDAGIHRQITLSTDLHDLEPSLEIAEHFSSVYACLGIHPTDVTNLPENGLEVLEKHLTHPKVVAVGETGLDYYHPAPEGWTESSYHKLQRHLLENHFELAARHRLNIVLHTRDRTGTASFDDCLEIYKTFSHSVRAVFHCFPGTLEQAERVISLGGLVSFTGNVTFKNAKQIQQTAQTLPLSSFMLETDSPYLAPVPHRGQRNEPAYVSAVASYLCKLRNISLEELSAATEKTVNEFFKFTPPSR